MTAPRYYQQIWELPSFGGKHPCIGSWIVNGWAGGVGIREDDTIITGNLSRFVPHRYGKARHYGVWKWIERPEIVSLYSFPVPEPALANLAEACDSGKLNARIKAVISNKLDIKASEVARKYGLIYIKIPRMWGPKDDRRDAYKSDEAYSDKLFDWASFSSPKLVVLAGFTAKLHLKPMWQRRS
jgi:hypothetical protein